jgi:hypothetical protein
MILGKAPILQKSHLAGTFWPALGNLRPELAPTDICRQQRPVRRGIERGGGSVFGYAGFAQGLPYALRTLPPTGEHAHQALGVAGVIEKTLFLQLYQRCSNGGSVVALAEQRGGGLGGGVLATRDQRQRRGAYGRGIGRTALIDLWRATSEAQLSFSLSCSPAAFFGGRSLRRI